MKKCLFVVVFTLLGGTLAAQSTALYIVASGPGFPDPLENNTLGAVDQIMADRMVNQLGLDVDVVSAASFLDSDATPYDVVVVNETVGSGDVGSKLLGVAVPLVTCEAFQADDMQIGTPGWNNAGDNLTAAVVTDGGTALTAGIPTNFDIYDPTRLGEVGDVTARVWLTDLAPGAVEHAVWAEDSTLVALASIDTGAELSFGANAAERRVVCAITSNSDSILITTEDGWTMFENSVNWALGLTTHVPDWSIY